MLDLQDSEGRPRRNSVLSIKDESANECHRILLAGDFDLAAAPMVDERVDTLVRGGKHKLEIDLTHVEFIDSSGIASLVATRRKLGADGRSLVLTGAGSHLMKIFEITGLVRYFEFT